MSMIRQPNIGSKLAAVWFLLAGLLPINPAGAAGHVLQEVKEGKAFQGKIERATYDRNGVAWIGTFHQLFRLDGKRATLVDSSGSKDRRLAIAPGGERYAWMDNRRAAFG